MCACWPDSYGRVDVQETDTGHYGRTLALAREGGGRRSRPFKVYSNEASYCAAKLISLYDLVILHCLPVWRAFEPLFPLDTPTLFLREIRANRTEHNRSLTCKKGARIACYGFHLATLPCPFQSGNAYLRTSSRPLSRDLGPLK